MPDATAMASAGGKDNSNKEEEQRELGRQRTHVGRQKQVEKQ